MPVFPPADGECDRDPIIMVYRLEGIRPTHNALLYSALDAEAKTLECIQHSVHRKSGALVQSAL